MGEKSRPGFGVGRALHQLYSERTSQSGKNFAHSSSSLDGTMITADLLEKRSNAMIVGWAGPNDPQVNISQEP